MGRKIFVGNDNWTMGHEARCARATTISDIVEEDEDFDALAARNKYAEELPSLPPKQAPRPEAEQGEPRDEEKGVAPMETGGSSLSFIKENA